MHITRKKLHFTVCLLLIAMVLFAQEKPLNIVVLGAHPDDCEGDAGGMAILYAKMGHRVKFVSLTNGDAGHYELGGGALARIRMAEAQEAGKRYGVLEYTVFDNHDGELMPTLENRLKVIREIRRWNADVVIGPRPNDYHPDHRNTAILMQDAAYLVIVPNVAPDVPPLKKMWSSFIHHWTRRSMDWQLMNLNTSNGCHGQQGDWMRYLKMNHQD